MSKTRKTNAAYRAWKKVKALFPIRHDDPQFTEACEAQKEATKTGQRWGNQRKMRAQMKVDGRKAERKRLNRIDPDEH